MPRLSLTCESVFGTPPDAVMMTSAAIIISWNLWQMDGLKGQTPDGRECLIRDWEAGECVRWSEVLGCGIADSNRWTTPPPALAIPQR